MERLTPDEYLEIVQAEPPRAEPGPPTSGTEAYIRAESAKDRRRAARNMWLLIALFILAILVLVFATAPLYTHCSGIDTPGRCLDWRIGGQG